MLPSFETVVGQRQSAALSTLPFNLCVDKVIRNEKTNPGGTVFSRTRQCLLLYADDMVVLGSAVQHVAETAEDITTAASQIGLTINVSKTKYMINTLNAELNSICHLLALLGAQHILHISRLRVNIKKRGTELEEIEINGWRY